MARGRSPDFDLNRESIVRTAARLFAEQGYPGTSMSDLARACGISKPLLYHYVDDKYQLLFEITDGHVSRLEALVAEVHALQLAPVLFRLYREVLQPPPQPGNSRRRRSGQDYERDCQPECTTLRTIDCLAHDRCGLRKRTIELSGCDQALLVFRLVGQILTD